MQNFKGFIFDLDGTAANTLTDLKTAMNEMLAVNGLPERDDHDILTAINYGSRTFVELSLPEQYRNDEEYITLRHREYTVCYDRHYSDTTYLYPGVADTIYKLKSLGYKIAILSNKQHSHCVEIVNKLFNRDTFDIVLGQTELPQKPDPTAAFVVAGKLNLRPSEIIYVGDSHIDMITAVHAGMFPVGVSWGYRPPPILLEYGAKIIIEKPDKLFGLLTL